jgi:putative nucleotidyltransferase with HDIG domain
MLWMQTAAESEGASKTKRPWALQDLPPFRPVARKLMLLTARDDVPLTQVQQVLRTDAAFAAEVLHLANSPLVGMRSEITSILQAVMLLGLERIKGLATTLALRTFLTSGPLTDALQGCWRHNLATAIVSERLARFVHLDSDTCYTAGLLHDIGRLALLRACPDKYEQILSRPDASDADLLLREKSIFDIDHCQAGEWILEQWQFPKELREVVSLHHQKPAPGTAGLLSVVYAGWRLADFLGFSVLNAPIPGDIGEIVSVLSEPASQLVRDEFDRIAEEVAVKINAIECYLQ